eukprot:355797-Chlamydomonas_euryale.AAC.6
MDSTCTYVTHAQLRRQTSRPADASACFLRHMEGYVRADEEWGVGIVPWHGSAMACCMLAAWASGLPTHGPLDETHLAMVAYEVLTILKGLHERGIIHGASAWDMCMLGTEWCPCMHTFMHPCVCLLEP